VQTRVNDLETVVTECTGDGLGATIVAIQAGLGDNDAVRTLHKGRTLCRRRGVPPTDSGRRAERSLFG
jgi:hypothetical protein